MTFEAILMKFGLKLSKEGFTYVNKKISKRKQRKLLSEAFVELLKLKPNINKAEAKILAAEKSGIVPTEVLMLAKDNLKKVKRHKKKAAKKVAKRKRPTGLAAKTKVQLLAMAKRKKVVGRHKMTKPQLLRKLK